MASSLKVGDKVILNVEYDWYGTHLCSWTKGYTFDVLQVGAESRGPDYIVIGIGGEVTCAVHEKDLTPVDKPKKSSKPATAKPATNGGRTYPANLAELANKAYNDLQNERKSATKNIALNNSAVMQTDGKKIPAFGTDEDSIHKTLISYKNSVTQKAIKNIEIQSPSVVQNDFKFPSIASRPSQFEVINGTGQYKYSYEMNYDSDKVTLGGETNKEVSILYDMPAVRESLHLYPADQTDSKLRAQNMYYYNRFKAMDPNDVLTRTFAHVFFIKPDLNIVDPTTLKLTKELETSADFYYAFKHNRGLLEHLTYDYTAHSHQFMLYPSNKVRSFEVSDEYITTDTYGQGKTGYKVPYGKHNVESRTADKFTCTYIDDRRLTTYHLHKLWMDYISYVYRGKVHPKKIYMENKILDYPTCVYYFLTAEDGETIIFWSKYVGVFPIKAPSSSFSFSADNPGGIAKPEINIEYQYAWKEDFNPLTLIEFNNHGFLKGNDPNYNYTPIYQPNRLGPAKTWSGVPFVETFMGSGAGNYYVFKLRFRPDNVAKKK